MAHIVTVPLVVTQRTNGSYAYAYNGSPLPDDLADGEIERLVEGGFVTAVEDPVIETEPEAQAVIDALDGLTKAQLAEVAAAESIDLSGAKTVAEHVAVITAAREAKVPEEPVPAGSDSSNL